MAQDVTAFQAAMKEVWTQDTLEKQFYAEDPLLEKIEKRMPSKTIGDVAITPVWTGRAGGFSVVPSTGSSALNAADAQEVNQAQWKYTRQWKQIKLDTAVVTQSQGSGNAVADAVEVEVDGALSDLRKQVTRQLFLNGDALIAKCTTTSSDTEILLDPAGDGYDAIVREWLVPGQQIDIGTTSDEDSQVAGAIIQSVSESSAAPSITIDSSISTTSSHYVSIANARSGATSYECNGMRNILSTAALGGLDPATVPGWQPASVDTSGGAITLPRIYAKRRQVKQKGGTSDWALTSLDQVENIYKLLQSQVRFAGDGSLGAGDVDSVMVGKTQVDAHNDCPTGDFHVLTSKYFFALRTEKPYWVPQKFGNGQPLVWEGANSTYLVSAMEYYWQLCVNRRNAFASMQGLS